MGYDPERHHRRSMRLVGHDYGQPGAYYVTVCVEGKACVLGEVVDGTVRLSKAGVVIESWWGMMPWRFAGVGLDAYVVMPNHIHGIVTIEDVTENGPSLARIVQWFKSATTSDYRRGIETDGWESMAGRLWQRSYYDHIIRNEDDFARIQQYIWDNPCRWSKRDV